jgi:hypothetical protein
MSKMCVFCAVCRVWQHGLMCGVDWMGAKYTIAELSVYYADESTVEQFQDSTTMTDSLQRRMLSAQPQYQSGALWTACYRGSQNGFRCGLARCWAHASRSRRMVSSCWFMDGQFGHLPFPV